MSFLPSSYSSSNLTNGLWSKQIALEEVVKVQSATKDVMDYDEKRTIRTARRGEFSVKLLKQKINYRWSDDPVAPSEGYAAVVRVGFGVDLKGHPNLMEVGPWLCVLTRT